MHAHAQTQVHTQTHEHMRTQWTHKHACTHVDIGTHNRHMHAQTLTCRTKSYKVPETLSFCVKDPPQSKLLINAPSFIHSVNIC